MIQKGLAAVAALLFLAASHRTAPQQLSPPTPTASQVAVFLPLAQAKANSPAPARTQTVPSKTAAPANPQPATKPAPQATPESAPATPAGGAGTNAPNPSSGSDCMNGDCDVQPAHISIATPAPAPAPWTWQERVTWGANLVLVVLGYVALLVGISLLRKIERQTRYGEAAAQAAQESAQAAMIQAQALVRAERPWLLVSVLPSPSAENGFLVMATNRGRGPARILTTVHDIAIASDESKLPATPEFRNQPARPSEPRILLPGETTEILPFSREDVKRVCPSEEQLLRVEKWEEKIFLYGNVVYRDLAAPEDAAAYESGWFCWYIHGRQKSGMIMAGLPAYTRHS